VEPFAPRVLEMPDGAELPTRDEITHPDRGRVQSPIIVNAESDILLSCLRHQFPGLPAVFGERFFAEDVNVRRNEIHRHGVMETRRHRDDRPINITYDILVPRNSARGREFSRHRVGPPNVGIDADAPRHDFRMSSKRGQMKSFRDGATANHRDYWRCAGSFTITARPCYYCSGPQFLFE